MSRTDELKAIQDENFSIAKRIMTEVGRVLPMGFVLTRRDETDKLFESGWGIEFLDPKQLITHDKMGGHEMVGLMLNLAMDWKAMYEAVIRISDKAREFLVPAVEMAKHFKIDDPYMRTMRPFMDATNTDEKDIVSATMRAICEKVDAFAAMHVSEAWMAEPKPGITREDLPNDLSEHPDSVEVVHCVMETREIVRMLAIPILREPPKAGERRDSGKLLGFGEVKEQVVRLGDPEVTAIGRLTRFLKPLEKSGAQAS